LKALPVNCLWLGAVFAHLAQSASLSGPIDVIHYDVVTSLDFHTREISGHTAITLQARSPGQQSVVFSPSALAIESATLAGRPLRVSSSSSGLVVRFPQALRVADRIKIVIKYHGKPARGLVFDGNTVYSNYFTCDWMICSLEDFGEKASIELTLEGPPGMVSHGPGRSLGSARGPDGRERYRWKESRPYSAYLYGFALGTFNQVTDRHGPTELVYLSARADASRLRTLFAPTAEMLRFFEDKAGVRFPHARYVQVHTPGSEAQEAMNFSLIGEGVVAPMLSDSNEDWAIAHELAHQWWGNSITCSDMAQFWLNEGVTTFMVAAWKEYRWGRDAYDRELMLLARRLEDASRLGVNRPLTYSGQYPSLSARRAIQYSKGALFMDRLRRELGDETFWLALKAYTRKHAGGTVNSRDFQKAFEGAARRDLSQLFNEWVY
jgi:aminopeptidase N